MRYRVIAIFVALLAAAGITTSARSAEEPAVKGLYILTDYPAVTVRAGTTSSVSLRLQNYGLPPERLALSVGGVPSGWTATLIGGGQPVAAAMPGTNSSVLLELRLDIPREAPVGTETLTVNAEGSGTKVSLPIAVAIAKDLPAKLTLTPQLPELRGSARSTFEYQLSIKNDSGKKLLVSLGAQAPPNFEASFTELYGSQELSAVPVDPGQSKDVKLKVRPPTTAAARRYPVEARVAAEDATAKAELALDISGQPKIDLAGREGVLSAKAYAGTETSIPVLVINTGTAPAEQVELSGSAPSGWKIAFEPKVIDRIAPNEQKEVQALVTPIAKAIAGDYVTSMRASSRGETGTANFRITVQTSAVWAHRRRRHHRRRFAHPGRSSREVRTAMSEIVIDAQGLTKRYGAATAVDHVTFTVSSGEIFGLLGPNGAGKTTTILMLLGLSDISEGQARVLGHDPVREPLAVKRRVGYLPDSVGFYDYLTASDNLHYTARLIGIPRAERDQRVMTALDRVGLADLSEKRVATVLARHAAAARPCGNPDEGIAHRDPR